MLVCGLIPMTVWSGVPGSGCRCMPSSGGGSCCADASADSQAVSEEGCSRSCCAHSQQSQRTSQGEPEALISGGKQAFPMLGLPRPACLVCSCDGRPADRPSQKMDARGEFEPASCETSPAVALKAVSSVRASQLPSATELPPLDRLTVFCTLLV